MINTTKVLQQAHAELWAFRAELEDAWPTPDTLDALRFAVTEAGEALDAWMRANRPQYARNRERLDWDGAVLDELADCAMMLLTAVGSLYWCEDRWLGDMRQIERILATVVDALDYMLDGDEIGQDNMDIADEYIMAAVSSIATYPGMDLLPRLQSRYARIRAKQRRVKLVEVDGLIGGVSAPNGNRYDLDDHVVEPGIVHRGYGTDTF